jgi:hypothetical protein
MDWMVCIENCSILLIRSHHHLCCLDHHLNTSHCDSSRQSENSSHTPMSRSSASKTPRSGGLRSSVYRQRSCSQGRPYRDVRECIYLRPSNFTLHNTTQLGSCLLSICQASVLDHKYTPRVCMPNLVATCASDYAGDHIVSHTVSHHRYVL